MKKLTLFVLALLLIVVAVPVYAQNEPDNSLDVINQRDISLRSIHNELEEILKAADKADIADDPEMLYSFAVDQLFAAPNTEISNSRYYDLIRAYLVEIKVAYEDYCYCKNILQRESRINQECLDYFLSANSCLVYNKTLPSIEFELTDSFLDQTIGEIADRNERFSQHVASLPKAAATTSYSGSSAATYARTYALSYNTNYPSYALSGGDCTNFVSQCLYAGGIPMNGSNSSTGTYNSTTKWYCICTVSEYHGNYEHREYAVTTSWIRVSDFNTYMTTVASSKTTKTSISTLYYGCSVGDVVQLANKTTGTPYHTIIISKRDSSTAYFCGHSYNRKDASIYTYLDDSTDKFILFHFS